MRKALLAATLLFGLPGVAHAEPTTVAALGDSLTQGYGLPPEQGLVPQLQGWLDARGRDVTLLNAGVSGDTTAGGLSRVDWTLTPEVDGMILALGSNDMLRGIDPANARANLSGILQAAQDRGVEVLMVGVQAPGNYGPDYKAAFDSMYGDLAAEFGVLHAESFLSGLDAPPDTATLAARYMQSDGLHPNPNGVALMVESLGPQIEALLDRIAAGQ
jgi:acyl-CoA thioesterase-1